LDDELEDELEEPPPPPEELDELEDELVLLLDELELGKPVPGELELEDEVAPVGPSPPQAASIPAPTRAAPPESSTRNSRLSVSAFSSSRMPSATVASSDRVRTHRGPASSHSA
jgi:hypothetical protein